MIAGVSSSLRTSTFRSLHAARTGTGEANTIRRCRVAEQKLKGKKVAIIAADMVERVELVEPRKALEEAGAETTLVSLKPGEITTFNHFDPAEKEKVDITAEEVNASDYDALMIPGGV